MTKAEMGRLVADIETRHPVHALPLMAVVMAELVARLPDDPAPRALREHPHKRFVPMDVTIPSKESA